MMTYNFLDSDEDTLSIESDKPQPRIIVITPRRGVYVPNERVPEVVLFMLQAAGYSSDNPFTTEGLAIMYLTKLAHEIQAEVANKEAEAARLADMEAEADRNALESEAQRLYEAYTYGYYSYYEWSKMPSDTKQKWISAALAVRLIHQDGAA